eukprot:9915929-Heterocapsa_arctica.AAC.1
MSVPGNASDFVSDPAVRQAITTAIAKLAGVPTQMVEVTLRLGLDKGALSGRRLADSDQVTVDYKLITSANPT